jgi:hypothetical protein
MGGGAVERWPKEASRALYMAEGREGGPSIWQGGGSEEGLLNRLEGPQLADREVGGPCILAWARSGLYLSRRERGEEGPLPGRRVEGRRALYLSGHELLFCEFAGVLSLPEDKGEAR